MSKRSITVLMADDDPDDRLLTREAFEEHRVVNDLRFVEDGEELLAYLRREGRYADPATSPRPGLILLDLNMPRLDGREALAKIKADEDLKRIPVVVLTTSQEEADVFRSYQTGANSYLSKPVTFESLVGLLGALGRYWLEIVELTPEEEG